MFNRFSKCLAKTFRKCRVRFLHIT